MCHSSPSSNKRDKNPDLIPHLVRSSWWSSIFTHAGCYNKHSVNYYSITFPAEGRKIISSIFLVFKNQKNLWCFVAFVPAISLSMSALVDWRCFIIITPSSHAAAAAPTRVPRLRLSLRLFFFVFLCVQRGIFSSMRGLTCTYLPPHHFINSVFNLNVCATGQSQHVMG